MKKFLFTMFAMLSIGSTVYGDEVKVEDVTIPKNGKSAIIVNFNQSNKSTISGLTFKITLPEGVEFVEPTDADDVSWYATGSTFKGSVVPNIIGSSKRVLKVPMAAANTIRGSKGMVFAVRIKTSSTLTAGTTLKGTVSEVTDSPDGQTVNNLDGSEFNITVANCDAVLDENSPFAPVATTSAVNVLVKRTIAAEKWSTICLPFKITDLSIIGEGVQLADFVSYSSKDNYETMSINFSTASELKANKPYLIKTSNDVAQFIVSAKINPKSNIATIYTDPDDEDEELGSFIGSYTADFVIPKDALFISSSISESNKEGKSLFYYSSGTTRMKGFRGYFKFEDKLKTSSTSRAFINIDGETFDDATGIRSNRYISENKRVYSISGRYMGENVDMKSLPKGVYIVDGVKIVND